MPNRLCDRASSPQPSRPLAYYRKSVGYRGINIAFNQRAELEHIIDAVKNYILICEANLPSSTAIRDSTVELVQIILIKCHIFPIS